MSSILFKVLVTRFYKINTGFFLFLFILLFGLLNGKATMELHHAIMSVITGSWYGLAIAMIVWTLYNFKCVSFFVKEINSAESGFLFNLQAVNNKRQWYLLLQCQGAVYFPLLLYALITVWTGFREGHVLLAALFMLYQVLMCCAAAGIYFRVLNSTWVKPPLRLPAVLVFRKKSYPFYLLHYSLHNRKGTFIAVKIFSLLLLNAMVLANKDKMSREAICVLIMFLVSAHALLPHYYMRFVESEMTFLRNLPLSLMRRGSVYVLTYAVIFLPELLFLLGNTQHVMPVAVSLSLYAVAVSQLSFYTAVQYLKGMTTDRYTMVIFVVFFVNLLLLASFNLWFLFVAEAVVSVVLFGFLYYGHEAGVAREE